MHRLIHLMRHGKALDVGEEGVPCDAERPLSKKGAAIVKEVALGMAALGAAPDLVVSSPLLRARQTADIAAGILGGASVIVSPLLRPDGPKGELIDWLQKSQWTSILLVGHMPDLAALASLLICGHRQAGLDLKQAGVCCIAVAAHPLLGGGCLEWFLPPQALSRIAESR
jgi:phosphohistidine phosphatase